MSPHPQNRRRRFVALAATAAAATVLLAAQTGPAAAQPGKIRNEGAENAIAGHYIVVFKDNAVPKKNVGATTNRLAAKHNASVGFRYFSALRGFSAQMTKAEAEQLVSDPSVDFVEQDRTVRINATQTPTPSWGLDRLDQRNLPLDNSFTYTATASNVTAYVIDTGIRTTHSDFDGRASWGANLVDGNNTDCNGHGTHVAGTIGGSSYGVAKGVQLVAVKVLNCAGSGSFSGVAAGIDWVTAHHTSGPAVANMSLGASGSDAATERAIRNSIGDGVVYGIASGNSNANACDFTPARVAEAITVNATTRTDARASFSNFGTCTDIFAPGQDITSAWASSNTATNTISGTSMATPHVVGAAALILGANTTASPAAVWSTMLANSTPNKVTNPGTGSPNRLLRVGAGTSPPAGCNPATNGTDVAIPDNTTVTSRIAIAGCSGNASASTSIEVHIVHTYRGDLVVDLITPTGAAVNLLNRTGGSADNVNQTFTPNLSTYPANGVWTLRVRDAANADTGRIDSWTLDL